MPMQGRAVNAMTPMKGMKKCQNVPMPFTSSVPVATRDMVPVHLKKIVLPAMSGKLATGVSAQRLNLAVPQKGLGYAKKIVLRFVSFSN
jgi:hypothetical protein